jgi:hypothetical protein
MPFFPKEIFLYKRGGEIQPFLAIKKEAEIQPLY